MYEISLQELLQNRCKVVIYTKGKEGASLYTKDKQVHIDGLKVNVVDTTGAGDSFIGAFIYKLLENEQFDLNAINENQFHEYLTFANLYAAYITTQPGALASMADLNTINKFKEELKK